MSTERPIPEALSFLDDPKRIAEDERRQEIRKASFTRARLSEEERTVARGMQLEEIARSNIETMERARSEGNNRRDRGGATLDMIEDERMKLAEALADQGRYEEAALVHPRRRRQADFEEIAEAIERPDDEECPCGPEVVTLNGQEVEDDPVYAERLIYSPKHKTSVALEKCDRCGFVNARVPGGRLAARLASVEAAARVENRGRRRG